MRGVDASFNGGSTRPGPKVFAIVGAQPQAALESLLAVSGLNGGRLDRVVLVHGGDESKASAEQVRDEVADRGIVDRRSVALLAVSPYSAEIIGLAEDLVLDQVIAGGDGSELGDWHLLFGSGTQPMNVALAGAWFAAGRRDNLWYWNSRERTLSSHAHRHLGGALEFEEIIAQRGYRVFDGGRPLAAPVGTCPQCARARDWMFGSGDRARRVAAAPDSSAGAMWEHAVGHLLASLTGSEVSLNVTLIGAKEYDAADEGDRVSLDREIDVVVKASPPGTTVHPSVHTVVSCKQSVRRDEVNKIARQAADEVKQLAENFLGSESQSLLAVFVAPGWDEGTEVRPGMLKELYRLNDRKLKRVRRNDRIANRPSRKHWILHGLEMFGSSAESFDAVFRIDWTNPGACPAWASLDGAHRTTVRNMREWLLGPGSMPA